MGGSLFRRKCLLMLFLLLCAPRDLLCAQPSASGAAASYNQALQAMRSQEYDRSLAQIQEAISQDPTNLQYQYVLGLIYSRLKRFDEAEVIFTTLIQANEQEFGKAYFDLADIYMQQGQGEKALAMAERAASVDLGRAQYVKGAICMRDKAYGEAVKWFSQAAATKPELAFQALTQETIACYYQGKMEEARKVLKKILAMDLSPEKKAEAEKLLQTINGAAPATKPWQLSTSVGFIYDSNLLQNPVEQNARGVSDEADGGVLVSVTGRYTFLRKDAWKFGAGLNFYNVTYLDHHDLDLIGIRPSFYIQWERQPYFLNLEYSYSHFWLGSDSFVDVYSMFPSFVMLHGDRWRTVTTSGAEYLKYEDETPDTRHYFLGITEMYLLRQGKAHLRVGGLIDYQDQVPEARGDYVSYVIMAGFQWPVWGDRWLLDIGGQYIWRNYDFDPTISVDDKRRDQEQDLIVQLIGQLTTHLQMTLVFQQTWNDSNLNNGVLDPFNYRRTVTSCTLTYNF